MDCSWNIELMEWEGVGELTKVMLFGDQIGTLYRMVGVLQDQVPM